MRGFLIVLLVLTVTACGSVHQPTAVSTVPLAIDTIVSERPRVAPMVAALPRHGVADADDVDNIIKLTTLFETACTMRRSSNMGVAWDAASLRAELARKNIALWRRQR